MAMENLDLIYDDLRSFGQGRRKRSPDVLKREFLRLQEAVNTVRWNNGVTALIESPTLNDFQMIGYNHTDRDLLFGAMMGVIVADVPSTVTWNLRMGTSLAALADIQGSDFLTDSITTGTPVSPADLDALGEWESGFFLALEIRGVTGTPKQFFFRGIINS